MPEKPATGSSLSQQGPGSSGDLPRSGFFLWASRRLIADKQLQLFKACSPPAFYKVETQGWIPHSDICKSAVLRSAAKEDRLTFPPWAY